MDQMTANPDAERALVHRFLRETRAPGWTLSFYQRMEDDRQYLHTGAFAEDDPNRLAVNLLFKGILAKLAQIYPENPEPTVKPAEEVAPSDPILQVYHQARQQALSEVGETGAVILKKWSKQNELANLLRQAAQDGLSQSIAWIKTGWEEDSNRDSLGRRRRADSQRDNLLRLRRLSREYELGEWPETDGRYQELLDLSERARLLAQSKLSQVQMGDPRAWRWQAMAQTPPGQPVASHLPPEPEMRRAGFAALVEPENLRWDWGNVRSPRLISESRHWSERIWMRREQAAEEWGLTPEEAKQLGSIAGTDSRNGDGDSHGTFDGSGTAEVADPANVGLEAQTRDAGREVAVWERWDLDQGMVYWFCAGLDRFLAKQVMDTTTRRGHPYIPIAFNPATGRFAPISEVTMGKKLQENFNQILTDDWEARVAAYPFYAVLNGMLTPEDIEAIEHGRRAHKVVELSRPADEVAKAITSIKGEEYQPGRYVGALGMIRDLLQQSVGASAEAIQGDSKPEFARQVQAMESHMAAQAGMAASMMVDVLTTIHQDWLDYALAALPEEDAKRLAGPFARWPAANREEIADCLLVEVMTSGNRATRQADLQDLGTAIDVAGRALQVQAVAAQMGQEFDAKTIVNRAGKALDLRIPGGLLRPLAQGIMAQQMAMNGQGQPGQAGPATSGQPAPAPAPGRPKPAPAIAR